MSKGKTAGFSDKHGTGTPIDDRIRDAITARGKGNLVSCAESFQIAAELGIPPAEVGKTLDLMEYRITHCQMGLFGYTPDKKIVSPATDVPDTVADDLRAASASGRLPCQSAWSIADTHGMGKLAIGCACEGLGVKIKPCQLGAF